MELFSKNKTILIFIGSLLLMFIISGGLLIWDYNLGKNVELDEVILKNNKSGNSMFAIMLEQEDGTYDESESSSWPTDGERLYDEKLSGCIDSNGNSIDNAIRYDSVNNTAIVKTQQSAKCYLYFSLPPNNLFRLCKNDINIDECITNESNNLYYISDLWNNTLDESEYRYVGTNPNNYICFGTSDKATCTKNSSLYMYRIIGIFEDAQGNRHLKLIKDEMLDQAYEWNSDGEADVDWDQSSLYIGLNGSYFLTNTTYSYMQNTTWKNKIVDWNYTAVNTLTEEKYNVTGTTYGPNYYYTAVQSVYLHELNKDGKSSSTCNYGSGQNADCLTGEWKDVPAKIGLMYASDFLLSLGSSALNYIGNNNSSELSEGWLSNLLFPFQWTMSNYGATSYGAYGAWAITDSGVVDWLEITNPLSVRPVFYLITNTKITGGSGLSSNPYIIR